MKFNEFNEFNEFRHFINSFILVLFKKNGIYNYICLSLTHIKF